MFGPQQLLLVVERLCKSGVVGWGSSEPCWGMGCTGTPLSHPGCGGGELQVGSLLHFQCLALLLLEELALRMVTSGLKGK